MYDHEATRFNQIISGDYAYMGSSPDRDDLWAVYPNTVYHVSDTGVVPGDFLKGGFYSFDMGSSTDGLFFPPLMVDPTENGVAWIGLKSDANGPQLHRMEYQPGQGIQTQALNGPFSTPSVSSPLNADALMQGNTNAPTAGRSGGRGN